ncbi:MAG TPA: DUF6111 family protein [Hyphomonadaceae bacterium]|nr:DUF6111 family protein [Hyphomonadaceae bacterium]
MASRVFVELLLFLTPFMVFLVYRAASRDMLIRDRWPLTTLVITGAALAALALIITPLLEPSQSGKCFSPASFIDGKTIPAKEVPCAEAKQPGEDRTPSSREPAPVAPRDEGRLLTPSGPPATPTPQILPKAPPEIPAPAQPATGQGDNGGQPPAAPAPAPAPDNGPH